jgi:hypothetical protein
MYMGESAFDSDCSVDPQTICHSTFLALERLEGGINHFHPVCLVRILNKVKGHAADGDSSSCVADRPVLSNLVT